MEDLGPVVVKTLVNVLEVLSPLFVALAGMAVVKFNAYVKSKTQSQLLQNVFWKVSDLARTIVVSAEATTVKELRAKAADGKLSKEDGKAVLDAVVADIKSHLSLSEILAMGGEEKATKLLVHAVEAENASNTRFLPGKPVA